MDFKLTEEQELLRDQVRKFAEAEILPHWKCCLRNKGFPWDIYNKMVAQGFAGSVIPQEYGGAGLDALSFALVTEELCRADGGVGLAIGATSLVGKPLVNFGTPEQKAAWLPRIADGSAICAYAQTEPNAGSDVASIRTKGIMAGNELVISGTKQFITNGSIASLILALVRTGGSGRGGLSMVLVDAQKARAEGTLKILKDEDKCGLHCSPTTMFAFEECRVPIANVLGPMGSGFLIAMATLTASRVAIAAQGVGLAQAALDLAVAYSAEREQFGRKIGEFQMIQSDLAEMATMVDAARLLTYRAAWEVETQGVLRTEQFMGMASMAKLYASEIACEVAARAARIHGGMGFMVDSRISAIVDDVSVLPTYEGANNIQKLVIARSLLRPLGLKV